MKHSQMQIEDCFLESGYIQKCVMKLYLINMRY